MLFFALISQLHLLYRPSPSDATQTAFLTLLSPSPRLLIASMSVFFLVQQVDLRFFAFLKTRFPHKSFAFRSGVSLLLSQFLDTLLFSVAGLYGMVASLGDIILLSFAIKAIAILCFTPLAKWVRA